MPSIFDVLGPEPEPQGITGALRQGIGNMSEIMGQFLPQIIMDEEQDMSFGEAILGGFLMGLGKPIQEEEQRRAERRKMAAQLLPSLMPYMTPESRSQLGGGLLGVNLPMQPQLTQQQEIQIQTLQSRLSDPRATVQEKMASFTEIQKITGGDADVMKIFKPSLMDAALDIIRERIIKGGVAFDSLDRDEKDLILMAGFDPTDPLVLARANARGKQSSLAEVMMDQIGSEILKKYSTWKAIPDEERPSLEEYFDPGEISYLAESNLADDLNYAQMIGAAQQALDAATLSGNPELIQSASQALLDVIAAAKRRYGIGGQGANRVGDITDFEDWVTTAFLQDSTFFENLSVKDAEDFKEMVERYAQQNEDFVPPSPEQLDEVAARVESQFLRGYGLSEEDWEQFKKEMDIIRENEGREPLPSEKADVASILNRRRWQSKVRGAPTTGAKAIGSAAKAVGETIGALSTGTLPSESQDGMTEFQRANREKVRRWWQGATSWAKGLPDLIQGQE